MFDPNAPLPNFAAQQEQLQRQKMMAEMLRKKAGSPLPEGKMVGKQYVAPHFAEFLPGLLDQFQAGQAEREASKTAQEHKTSIGDAIRNWQSTLPRIRPAVPGQPELPGPRDENGSPELDAVAPVPAQLPDRSAILDATLRGMQIPGNEQAAALFNKAMGDELSREDTQTDRRESREAQLRQQRELELKRLEQRMEEAKLRSEDARASVEQRREAAAAMAEAKRQHTEMMGLIASMKADKPKELKPLPAAQAKAWTENNRSVKFIDDALKATLEYPEAFGTKNVLGTAIRSRTDPKGVNARALVSNIGSLKIHDRSGAAVSLHEMERLKSFIPIVDGPFADNAETIEKKLRLFQREYKLMQQEIIDLAETQGYKSPVKMVDDQPAAEAPASGGGNKVEARNTINGKKYIKVNGQWFEE